MKETLSSQAFYKRRAICISRCHSYTEDPLRTVTGNLPISKKKRKNYNKRESFQIKACFLNVESQTCRRESSLEQN